MANDNIPGADAQIAAQKKSLAYRNGVTSFKAGNTLVGSNPYKVGHRSFGDFVAGFTSAKRDSAAF